MLLYVKSQQNLSQAKEALINLGIDHVLHGASEGNAETILEIPVEKSILSPQKIAEELSVFGRVQLTTSKTPLLDQLSQKYQVCVKVPGSKNEIIFEAFSEKPVWIAGPCAIDSIEHLRTMAKSLSSIGVQVLRGGAVKPRTSPHDFQGVGRQGFKWLADIAHEFGLAAISETLSEEDVPEALEYLDIIQIGARNMQNFSLLRKLGQGAKPVLLKRAPGSTLKEWAMAAEYILAGGNKNVILCERGVRGMERELRYTLDFAGAAWMQQRYRLPVVIDPSHATGVKQLIGACTAAAFAMNMSGVMIEVHPKPSEARSDALQALGLEEFSLLKNKYNN